MHFEFLVEDLSGKRFLDILLPSVLVEPHTFRVFSYKGIGRVPQSLKAVSSPQKRILLTQLPRLLNGYGKTHTAYGEGYKACVFVICDIDNQSILDFKAELITVLESCEIKPDTHFCFAVEEGEAWLLGDISAVRAAYPEAKLSVLQNYQNDSICGTWECLADAIYPGGAVALSEKGWHSVGKEKSRWAESITPQMDIEINLSPSFKYFLDKLNSII